MPRWPYVPGRGGGADHDTLDRVKASVPARFVSAVPADHPVLIYGLALNDCGFFWECHEILEAIWTVAPQGGRDRILLRACIQIANANLKRVMAQRRAVDRLLKEALGELEELSVRKIDGDGIAAKAAIAALADIIRQRISTPVQSDPIRLGWLMET